MAVLAIFNHYRGRKEYVQKMGRSVGREWVIRLAEPIGRVSIRPVWNGWSRWSRWSSFDPDMHRGRDDGHGHRPGQLRVRRNQQYIAQCAGAGAEALRFAAQPAAADDLEAL